MQPNPAASLQRGCPVRPWSSLAALIRVTAGPLRSLGGRGTRRAGHTPPTDAAHRLSSDAVNLARVPRRPRRKGHCRELVTFPRALPAMEGLTTLPKGVGRREHAGVGPLVGGCAPKTQDAEVF